MATYTAKDIEVLEGLEPVRKRPAMYIGGTDARGYHHLLWEILDNSIDEAINGHAKRVEVALDADHLGVTVTDDSVLEMIDKREQSPRLPVMVLLESEVRELADAHVYLDPQNEKSPLAVDLLLGTQGWRRFALVNWQKFVEQHKDQARRALAFLDRVPK